MHFSRNYCLCGFTVSGSIEFWWYSTSSPLLGLHSGENRGKSRDENNMMIEGKSRDKWKIKYNAASSHDTRAPSESRRAAHSLAHTLEHLRQLRMYLYVCKIVDNLFNLSYLL